MATNRTDGLFLVNINISDYDGYNAEYPLYMEEELRLRPCQLCLAQIDWQGMKNIMKNWEQQGHRLMLGPDYYRLNERRWSITNKFNVKEFNDKIKQEILKEMGLTEIAKQLNNPYSMVKKEYWLDPQTKRALKIQQDYRCQKCTQQFAEHELYIHHQDHNQGNNSPQNLIVLCKSCHRAIHAVEGGLFMDDED